MAADVTREEFVQLVKSTDRTARILVGDPEKNTLGVYHKVEILWRWWIWVLCTMSAGAGAVATLGVQALLA